MHLIHKYTKTHSVTTAKYGKKVRRAEKKFASMARVFWAIMQFLPPPHPQVEALASDGHPEIYYHGVLRSTCRLEIRDPSLRT